MSTTILYIINLLKVESNQSFFKDFEVILKYRENVVKFWFVNYLVCQIHLRKKIQDGQLYFSQTSCTYLYHETD